MIRDEDLVPVRDQREIEPGMTLVIKRCCTHPPRTCTLVFFSWVPGSTPHAHTNDTILSCPGALARTTHPSPNGVDTCLQTSADEGRLFRLRPEESAQHEARQLERVLDR